MVCVNIRYSVWRWSSFCLSLSLGGMLSAQVGKGSIVDLNTAAEKDLLALPHMTPAIVKGLIEKRPFGSIVEANAYLTGQSLTPAQLTEFYGKAFIHVNLNTGTREEILLIPGAGNRMVREFAEYRPWKTLGPVRQGDQQVRRTARDRSAQAVRVHSRQPEHRERRGHPEHSRCRSAHGARVQGIPPLEDQGAVREGDREVRRRQGNRAPLAVCRDSVGF